MEIIIIAAISENNALGKDNLLLWHLPNDLKRFKKNTSGFPIIMGRKTYESIGGKPLPKRENIVISSKIGKNENNISWVNSLEQAINKAISFNKEKVFIIGGGQIYTQSLKLANKLDITRIYTKIEADVYFPEIDLNIWDLIQEDNHLKDEKHIFDYSFCTYVKKN